MDQLGLLQGKVQGDVAVTVQFDMLNIITVGVVVMVLVTFFFILKRAFGG